MPDVAELFTFSRLDNVRRYTSYHRAVVYGGETYAPAVIKRGAFTRKMTDSPARMNITAPISDVFSMYKMGTPVYPVTAEVRRVLLATPDVGSHILFKGSVVSVSLKGQMCVASCQSIGVELERTIPSVMYQPSCSNDLFDDRCGLNRNDYKMTVKVFNWLDDTHRGFYMDADGTDAWGDDLWNKSGSYWAGGYCVFGDDKRFITTSSRVFFAFYAVLHYPIDDLEVGDVVTMYPGCTKSPQTCLNDFSNLENFVGFPYIPTLSPLKWGIKEDEE